MQVEQNGFKSISAGDYKAQIFATRDGDKVFVTDPNGNQIYAHRTNKGKGMARAWEIINQHAPKFVHLKDEVCDRTLCAAKNFNGKVIDWNNEYTALTVLSNERRHKIALKYSENGIFGSCDCKDFIYRAHLCRHLALVGSELFEVMKVKAA